MHAPPCDQERKIRQLSTQQRKCIVEKFTLTNFTVIHPTGILIEQLKKSSINRIPKQLSKT